MKNIKLPVPPPTSTKHVLFIGVIRIFIIICSHSTIYSPDEFKSSKDDIRLTWLLDVICIRPRLDDCVYVLGNAITRSPLPWIRDLNGLSGLTQYSVIYANLMKYHSVELI